MIKFIIADTRGIYLEDKSFIAHYINVFNSLSTIISKSFSNYEIVFFAGVSKYKEIIDNTNFYVFHIVLKKNMIKTYSLD